MAEVNFPERSNSHRSKEEREKRVQTVANGSHAARKTGFLEKLLGPFLVSDGQDIISFLIKEKAEPFFKDFIYDMANSALEMKLYGSSSGGNRRTSRSSYYYNGNEKTSYDGYYHNDNRDRTDHSKSYGPDRRDNHNIIFREKYQADEALKELYRAMKKFGSASLADLYDVAGLSSEFTDNNVGWSDVRDLDRIRIKPVRDGYMLVVPQVYPID